MISAAFKSQRTISECSRPCVNIAHDNQWQRFFFCIQSYPLHILNIFSVKIEPPFLVQSNYCIQNRLYSKQNIDDKEKMSTNVSFASIKHLLFYQLFLTTTFTASWNGFYRSTTWLVLYIRYATFGRMLNRIFISYICFHSCFSSQYGDWWWFSRADSRHHDKHIQSLRSNRSNRWISNKFFARLLCRECQLMVFDIKLNITHRVER